VAANESDKRPTSKNDGSSVAARAAQNEAGYQRIVDWDESWMEVVQIMQSGTKEMCKHHEAK
jgi:hypothetical protein